MGRREQAGFTLIELVVVIAIAVILAGIAIVKTTSSSQQVRLRAAAKKLQADLEYAQELAMNLGREVQVHFDLQNNRYQLTWSDGTPVPTPAGGRDYIVQFGSGDYRSVQITASNLLGFVLRFRPDGRPHDGGGLLSQRCVVARLGDRWELWVEPGTGNVELRDLSQN